MYAHITNGVVDLAISVSPESIFGQPYAAEFIAATNDVAVGWLWDGSALTPPPPMPEPVPAQCTRRQGQLVLLSHGLLDDAEAAISAITDPNDRRAAQIEYDADTWERRNAFLSQLWAQLGGTSESLDEAFRTAVTL